MIKFLKKGLFLPLLALLLLLNSCNLSDSDNNSTNGTTNPPQTGEPVEEIPDIIGTWLDQYGSEIKFTDTHYYNSWNGSLSHSGEFQKRVNNSYYNDELPGTTGYYGYVVVKYTGGFGDGQYGVIRWKSLKTANGITTMEYSEGNNASGYFASAAEAEAGMTDAASYFGMYSTATKQ